MVIGKHTVYNALRGQVVLYKGECAIEICCNSTRDCLDPEISTKCKGHVGMDLVTHTQKEEMCLFFQNFFQLLWI